MLNRRATMRRRRQHPPSRQRLAALLQSCGLSLIEHRVLGQESGGKHACGGFAVALAN
jgi:hypothetical protein